METVHGACNLCEAICGLRFTIDGGRITSINGDPDDPLSRGHICPKAIALGDIQADPDRLRKPVRRTPDGWVEISWDEAYDLVVDRLIETRQRYGSNAVGLYLGNPSVHNYGILTHGPHFFGQLRTRNRFSATSVDQLPHQLVVHWLYGHQLLIPIPDIDNTNYFLVFGANPLASNGSLMTVPDVRRRLVDLKARGGKVVVFDPRRTETAALADEHHFVRPGSDAALLLALLHCVFADGTAEPTAHVDGLDAVREAVAAFTPERVAAVTGVDADVIRRVAREFAAAEGAACYGRVGVSIQRFGALSQWAIQLLNLATGNLDRPGGALFTRPAVDLVGGGLVGPGHYDKWRSRVRGLPEFSGELPVAALAEEILTPGDGQIRALVTVAGNPVLSTPNGGQLDRALDGLDFMVAVDFYVNETTRHADVILPPTTALEHDHYDVIFHALAVRNTARYSPAVLPKPADARHDWEIFTELARRYARRLGRRPAMRRRLMMRLRPHQQIAAGLRLGPYPVSLRALRRRPSGVDFGPLRPSFPGALRTPDKRVHAAPTQLLDALREATEELLAAPEPGQLRLIGRRHLRSNNSWMHNYERLVKGRPRHHLFMHPDDLAARGLRDGQRVRVRSRVGEVEVEVAETADIMPGVVSLPHGWGHARPDVRLSVASRTPGVSINDLTDDTLLDELSGNAALNGVVVTVESASG
ncbi:molybdopterin-dependent oxidoreductase [Phytohabitans rumicis]|uniref:Oxidoreductase n=1 Tax=Phytohabitans rumicis TaxID=1076125 RepID=A0A6V8KTD7_9ACTN|nr:molybdopterin-dependent oxidoreductase [Phytohabitans rumicis]GFJ88383.1 oxidoreductase [Phytohabitans rumicis]